MMQIPEQAIEKAEEGGWESSHNCDERGCSSIEHAEDSWQEIALDKTFWSALGKALGWSEERKVRMSYYGHAMSEQKWMPESEFFAHRFYDLILTGGDTEKFWQEILPTEE